MLRSETMWPRILMPLMVFGIGWYLLSQAKNTPVLDTRLFYFPEEALRYFTALDSSTRERVVRFSMIDAMFFVPAYGITLWVLSKSFRLGKPSSQLLLTLVLADTLENILIAAAATMITAPGWPLLILLSLTTPLKWTALGAWFVYFLTKVLFRAGIEKK